MKTARVLFITLVVSLVSAVPLGVNAWPNLCTGAVLAYRQARLNFNACAENATAFNDCLSEYTTMTNAMNMMEQFCYYSE